MQNVHFTEHPHIKLVVNYLKFSYLLLHHPHHPRKNKLHDVRLSDLIEIWGITPLSVWIYRDASKDITPHSGSTHARPPSPLLPPEASGVTQGQQSLLCTEGKSCCPRATAGLPPCPYRCARINKKGPVTIIFYLSCRKTKYFLLYLFDILI